MSAGGGGGEPEPYDVGGVSFRPSSAARQLLGAVQSAPLWAVSMPPTHSRGMAALRKILFVRLPAIPCGYVARQRTCGRDECSKARKKST
jgi:hypothetical protein